MSDIDHPDHYGGKDNPHEAIKVIEAWGLGFKLGNAVKYLLRAGRKPGVSALEDLDKARWYLSRAAERYEHRIVGDPSQPRLAHAAVSKSHGLGHYASWCLALIVAADAGSAIEALDQHIAQVRRGAQA